MSLVSILVVLLSVCCSVCSVELQWQAQNWCVWIWFGCLDIVKSLSQSNDAVGWILVIVLVCFLHEFLVNSCGSFIFLLRVYCSGTVRRKRSVWIGIGCLDIVKSLTQLNDAVGWISCVGMMLQKRWSMDIVKSLTLYNDAVGWISVIVLVYLQEFLVNYCGSFISLLCVGMVQRKRSVWIWFGCFDIVKSHTQIDIRCIKPCHRRFSLSSLGEWEIPCINTDVYRVRVISYISELNNERTRLTPTGILYFGVN